MPTAKRPNIPAWLGLAVSIALHLMAVYYWPALSTPPILSPTTTPALAVQLMRMQTPEPPTMDATKPVKPKPVAAASHQKPSSTTAIEAPKTASTAPELAASIEVKEPAPVVTAPTGNLLSNAKRDIGKIDRDLRKTYPKLLEAAPDSAQSRLEKGIAAAAKPNAFSMEDIISPDGRRMTKVTGPGGTYCVRKEGAGATDGLDAMQNGVRAKTTNCPNDLSF